MTETTTGFADLKFAQNEASLAEFMARQAINGMATVTIVRVEAVNGDTVDVLPMVHQIDGAGTAIPHGIIHDVPWFSLRAGAAAVRATPVVGDIGMAAFCHNDTSSVRATKKPAPPPTRRRFDWADGLYFGGFLGPTATAFVDITEDQIEVKAPAIKLTGPVEITGDVSVTGSLTATGEVTGNGKALSTHTHGSVTVGSGTSGPPT